MSHKCADFYHYTEFNGDGSRYLSFFCKECNKRHTEKQYNDIVNVRYRMVVFISFKWVKDNFPSSAEKMKDLYNEHEIFIVVGRFFSDYKEYLDFFIKNGIKRYKYEVLLPCNVLGVSSIDEIDNLKKTNYGGCVFLC